MEENKNDFIKIPFGAKDSELIEATYYIPEGMEAVIEDNKVVIRKKDSEDEKTRKDIISVIEWAQSFNASGVACDEGKKMIVWLEKQKSVEWSEEDEKIRKALIDVLNSDFEKDTKIHGITVSQIIAWLERQRPSDEAYWKMYERTKDRFYKEGLKDGKLCKRKQEEQKSGWSLQDEKQLENIFISIRLNNALSNDKQDELICWLQQYRPHMRKENKSIEWSVEELLKAKKEAFNEVLDKIEYHSGEPTFDDGWSAAIKWASHFQPRQKLSEEDDKPLYIRFGDIPPNEKSKIYSGGEEVGEENGVSVYPAFVDNEGNIILGTVLPITKTTLYTQQHLLEYDNRPCYLVNGDYVGKDSDGQPLIKNIGIVKKIENYQIKEKKQGEQKHLDYPYIPGWRENCPDNKPQIKHSVLMLTTHGVAEGEWLGEEWCQYRWSCKVKDADVLYWLHLSDLESLEKEGELKPVELAADEKIRKSLLKFLNDTLNREQAVNIDKLYDWIAWLEKQDVQKPHLSHDDKIMIGQLTEYFTTGKGLQNTTGTVVEWLEDVKEKLSRDVRKHTCEWKPTQEQLEYLSAAIEDLGKTDVLKSLFNDLVNLYNNE